MKNLSLKLSLIITALWSGQLLFAQADNVTDLPHIEEKIRIITDRTVYSSDETISFRANYSSSFEKEHVQWSTVLYIEVIKADGSPVIKDKFSIVDNGVNGKILIPDNLSSGQYFMKAYTKWMRNFTPVSYAYTPVIIVNPRSKKGITLNENCSNNENFEDKPQPEVSITLKENSVVKRATIEGVLTQSTSSTPYTVSVVKKGTKDISASTNSVTVEYEALTPDKVRYAPEIDGLIMSGTVSIPDSGVLKDISLHLTMMNGQPYFCTAISDENGRFHFKLPALYNHKDFFITADSKGQNIALDLDPEFCTKPIKICLDNNIIEHNENIEQVMINAQLLQLFEKEKSSAPTHKKNSISFYGLPNRTIYTDDYIDLPYIEEFIFELIPEFDVIRKKGRAYVKTNKQNTFSPFPVLLLIDNIPVYNPEEFLKIRTNKIERIELIDNPYLIGKLKYNGIIHLKTKNQDFAGIDLPANSMFFRYLLYSQEQNKKDINSFADKRLPDRRNCLYWNPEFHADKQNGSFSFTASDVPGTYEVIVQYLDANFQVQTVTAEFEIKE